MPFHVEQMGGVAELVEVEFLEPPQPIGHPRKVRRKCDSGWYETVVYAPQVWADTPLQAWDKWREVKRQSIEWHIEAAENARQLLAKHLTDGA